MGNYISKICPWCKKTESPYRDHVMDTYVSTFVSRDLTDPLIENNLDDLDKIRESKTLREVRISICDLVIKRNRKPSEIYELLQTLGEGSFGLVMKVKHKLTQEIRAMKCIKRENLDDAISDSNLEQEINILRRLDHPNVMKIFEFFQDDNNYYLVTEYCSEGDLLQKIQRLGYLDESIVRILMHQILSAVRYLHSKNVIHGDLKLENVLIFPNSVTHKLSFNTSVKKDTEEYQNLRNSAHSNGNFMGHNRTNSHHNPNRENISVNNGNQKDIKKSITNPFNKPVINLDAAKNNNLDNSSDNLRANDSPAKNSQFSSPRFKYQNISNFELKLIDFGCSKIFSKSKNIFDDVIGTAYYAAPEVLNNNFDEKCDLWSCGVIMYMFLSGLPPFQGNNEEEICKNVKNGHFDFDKPEFKKVSEQSKDLIRLLMQYNPKDRISAAKALKHPFFTDELDPNNIYNDNIDGSAVLRNLKQFKTQQKFSQAVFAYITHNFGDAEEKKKLTQLFRFIDKNGDGKLSREELIECYQDSGELITAQEIDNILAALDDDGSGFIEYEEFVRACLDKKKLMNENNLKMAFDLFDLDNSGEISVDEIRNILGEKNLSDNVIKEFLQQIGKSESDLITFDDFKTLMLSCIHV